MRVPAEAAWRVVCEVVAATPRTRIIARENGYLHAEARSRLLGFVDDLELALDFDLDSDSDSQRNSPPNSHPNSPPQQLHARSASRLGYSDRGVNRRRLELLRQRLIERQVIEP